MIYLVPGKCVRSSIISGIYQVGFKARRTSANRQQSQASIGPFLSWCVCQVWISDPSEGYLNHD